MEIISNDNWNNTDFLNSDFTSLNKAINLVWNQIDIINRLIEQLENSEKEWEELIMELEQEFYRIIYWLDNILKENVLILIEEYKKFEEFNELSRDLSRKLKYNDEYSENEWMRIFREIRKFDLVKYYKDPQLNFFLQLYKWIEKNKKNSYKLNKEEIIDSIKEMISNCNKQIEELINSIRDIVLMLT
jgi:hypothetical protein